MFLALDESKGYGKSVLGLIAIPLDALPSLEGKFCQVRLDTKLMGEVCWEEITDKYLDRYLKFVDLFLNHPGTSFHSIAYNDTNGKYRAAYALIRLTSWKLWNAGIKADRSLFILFDQDSEAYPKPERVMFDGVEMEAVQEFRDEYDAIKRIAVRDGRFRHPICYCNQGSSHQLGVLQLTDLLTGAMNAVINKRDLPTSKQSFVAHIEATTGHAMDASRAEIRTPKLSDYKTHFFDPDDAPVSR